MHGYVAEMEFRALGSLSVRSDGGPVALGGPKQRMVLALLLIDANRVVSVDRLIDGVWGERPPPAARHTLHGYVSELRKVLGGRPERAGAGYLLRVEPESFDVLRFQALCVEGRKLLKEDPPTAAQLLTDALACWEGTPYADLSSDPALDGEVRRLTDLRLEAAEDRVEASLIAGMHRGLIAELESLVREHPFRERFWGQLMVALYRAGRQTEALRAFGRLRHLLAEELGIEPSPELQALEQRILDQDADLAPAAPAPVEVPAGGPHAIRGYELRRTIGESDAGTVYEAYQPSTGRRVALKAFGPEHANTPVFVQRFEAEQQFVAQLAHPHIVPLFDYWRDPSGGYLVMPYLSGGSLDEALSRGPWNTAPALRLLDQIGSALAYAHRQGMVHRNVKPSNVLLDAEGNAYLSDFGHSDLGISATAPEHTGRLPDSSAHHPTPEVIRAELPSPSNDVVGLALLAFELLSGVRPDPLGPLPPIDEIGSGLPPELADVLARATDDDPSRRPERIESFLRELRQAMGADVVGAAALEETSPATSTPIRNPYKGLRAFHETDAPDFHGRDALVDELLSAISTRRFVAVVGPSGCGKSSVVRAGLVPALRAGAASGSQEWLITDMFPGSFPFEELESALLRVAVRHPGSLLEELQSDEQGLLRAIKGILPTDDSELLLIIDQFEELFVMVDDEAARRLLLDALTTLVTDERSRVRVIVTLRADFFDRPLEYPAFGRLVRDGLVAVSRPDEEALAQAIARPARGVGLDLEPGLGMAIVQDVRDEPGGLPLLQHALTELFRRRRGDVLTIAAYRDSGGVRAALGVRAEELYGALSPGGQEATRQLFLRLVNVGEDADDTRRRVRQGELETLGVDHAALEDAIKRFASYRLLTFDRDPITRSPTVEVAHEALLREWARLEGWIDEQRGSLVLHRRFAAALREWEESGRASAFLLSGGRLAQFDTWAKDSRLLLTGGERAFLELSRIEDRRRRRSRTVLRWGAAATLGALATVALVQARIAQREARAATIRELAGQSTLSLPEDPERSILLALEAVDRSLQAGEDPLPEAVGALNDSVQSSRLELRLPDGVGNVAISPDGRLVATDSLDPDTLWPTNEVVIWDVARGVPSRTLSGTGVVSMGHPAPGIEGGRSLAFSPQGNLLAVAFQSDAAHTPIVVWDPLTGHEVVRLMAPGQVAWTPAWSRDGSRLLAASAGDGIATITGWEVPSGEVLFSIRPGFVGELGVYDEGRFFVTHGPAEQVGIYDLGTGAQVDQLHTPGLAPVYLALDPAHGRLAVSARHERLQVWEVQSGALLWSRPLSSSRRIAVDPEGRLLALTGAEGLVRLLDLRDGTEVMTLAGHPTAVGDVAFSPAGDRLASTANDGETRLWSVRPGGPPALEAIQIVSGRPFMLDFSPDGRQVGASTWDGTFELHDAGTGELTGIVEGIVTDAVVNPVVSHDLRLLAGVSVERQEAVVWDIESGRPEQQLPPCTNPRAFSPDGSVLVLDGAFRCAVMEDAPAGTELRSRVIDVVSGRELLDLGERVVFRAAFNPAGAFEAGRYLAVNIGTAVLEIYDMSNGYLTASFEIMPTHIRFDPTGRYVATGTLDGRVFVLDLVALVAASMPEEAVVMDESVAPGGIPGIAITSGGIVAASAFDSSFIRVWDVRSGAAVAVLRTRLDGSSPPHLNFSPDGEYLLYPDADQVLRRFVLDTDRLVELARSRVSRSLTVDECRRYLDPASCG
jgi:DNA-binding SARP family transcriptional activator/serine/threonine protein kinase/WD40 repeat protein